MRRQRLFEAIFGNKVTLMCSQMIQIKETDLKMFYLSNDQESKINIIR